VANALPKGPQTEFDAMVKGRQENSMEIKSSSLRQGNNEIEANIESKSPFNSICLLFGFG